MTQHALADRITGRSAGRFAGRAAALLGAVVAAAWLAGAPAPAAAQPNPDTGARPGNEIGTGSSLPLGTAASNLNAATARSTIAPNLPSPAVGPGAGPRAYLMAARAALAAGRTGEAQQALEMAETRALDRSTPLGATGQPSTSPLVAQIARALQALANGDRGGSVAAIDAALPMATP